MRSILYACVLLMSVGLTISYVVHGEAANAALMGAGSGIWLCNFFGEVTR